MKKIINLLFGLSCLALALCSCSNSADNSAKKYDYKLEFASINFFWDDNTNPLYIKQDEGKKTYTMYCNSDCTDEAGSGWTFTKAEENFALQFKRDDLFATVSINTKDHNYSYYGNTEKDFSIRNLKVDGTKYKPIVDHTIQIKITAPEQYKCDDTWYLIKNYKDSDNNDNFLVFLDEYCTQEKKFSSGNVNAVQDNSKDKLYLTLCSGETPLFIARRADKVQDNVYETRIVKFAVDQDKMNIDDEKYQLLYN